MRWELTSKFIYTVTVFYTNSRAGQAGGGRPGRRAGQEAGRVDAEAGQRSYTFNTKTVDGRQMATGQAEGGSGRRRAARQRRRPGRSYSFFYKDGRWQADDDRPDRRRAGQEGRAGGGGRAEELQFLYKSRWQAGGGRPGRGVTVYIQESMASQEAAGQAEELQFLYK